MSLEGVVKEKRNFKNIFFNYFFIGSLGYSTRRALCSERRRGADHRSFDLLLALAPPPTAPPAGFGGAISLTPAVGPCIWGPSNGCTTLDRAL